MTTAKRGRPKGSTNNVEQPPLYWYRCTCGVEFKAIMATVQCKCGKAMKRDEKKVYK